MAIDLATEASKAPSYPNVRFNARERKVLESVKVYVDGAGVVVSDTAYAVSWNGVTGVAPSKNAVYDKVEALDAAKQNVLTMDQATTGTAGTVGQIAIPGMTATGAVVVTAAEALGNNIVISHVIAGTDLITVFVQDTNASGAAVELDAKKVNYIVISLS